MEFKQDESLHDKDDNKTRDALKPDNKMQAKDNATGWEGGRNIAHDEPSEDINASAEVNMEALLTSDDVIRAGGFGARDDISSFLPVASDSTDFEATIRDARGYEEPQGNICRPGLGWRDSKETE